MLAGGLDYGFGLLANAGLDTRTIEPMVQRSPHHRSEGPERERPRRSRVHPVTCHALIELRLHHASELLVPGPNLFVVSGTGRKAALGENFGCEKRPMAFLFHELRKKRINEIIVLSRNSSVIRSHFLLVMLPESS